MEYRKVQVTGGSSMAVTLPKDWAARSGLARGTTVAMTEQPDGSLAIRAGQPGERDVPVHVIAVRGVQPTYLFRRIVAAYVMGHEMIRIQGRKELDPDTRLAVQDAAQRIIGLEIIEEERDSITLQDFLDPRDFHLDKAVRRMALLVEQMQADALRALRDPGSDAGAAVTARDDEVDRLYWLVNKQLHVLWRDASYASKLQMSPSQALNLLLVARLVERTGDHACRWAAQGQQLAERTVAAPVLDRLQQEGRAAATLFQAAIHHFRASDAERAHRTIEAAEALQVRLEDLLEDATRTGSEHVPALAYVLESIRRTAAYAADIGEVTINHQAVMA